MENLGHLLNQATVLTAGESGSAGNTVNRPSPAMDAPGSAPVNPMPSELDSPGLELPAEGANIFKPKFSHEVTNVPANWKKAGE